MVLLVAQACVNKNILLWHHNAYRICLSYSSRQNEFVTTVSTAVVVVVVVVEAGA